MDNDAVQQDVWVLNFLKQIPKESRKEVARKFRLKDDLRNINAQAAFDRLIGTAVHTDVDEES
jgi:hypothetical protein